MKNLKHHHRMIATALSLSVCGGALLATLWTSAALAHFSLVKDVLDCSELGFRDLARIRLALTNTDQIYARELDESGREQAAYFVSERDWQAGSIELSASHQNWERSLNRLKDGSWQLVVHGAYHAKRQLTCLPNAKISL